MTKKEGRFNCKVDKELLKKYMDCVPNASEDIRAYMQRRVNQGSTIQELKVIRVDLITQIENLKSELDEIDAQIEELQLLRQDNALNKKKMMDALDIVKNVSLSGVVEGITLEKVEEIAENKEIKPHTLVNECKKQGIKFISKKSEEYNSSLTIGGERTKKRENETDEHHILNSMLKLYSRDGVKYSNNKDKFLQDAKVKNKYTEMCGNIGISFDEIAERFKKLGRKSKADD